MAGAAGELGPGGLRLSRAGSLSRLEAGWSVVRSGIKAAEDLLPEGTNLSVGAKKQQVSTVRQCYSAAMIT